MAVNKNNYKCYVFFFNFKKLFILYWSIAINNVMIVSDGQQRDSARHKQVAILPQTPLLSRLSHDIEQSSLCYKCYVFKKLFPAFTNLCLHFCHSIDKLIFFVRAGRIQVLYKGFLLNSFFFF